MPLRNLLKSMKYKSARISILSIFIISFMFIFNISFACATEYMPYSSKSFNSYMIGIYFAPEEIKIYSNPDEKAELEAIIRWNIHGTESVPEQLSSSEVFLAFVPSKKYALMQVVSENDNDDWVEIIYNKKTGKKGWVKNLNFDKFKPLLEFIQTNGKDHNLYFLSDVPEKYKTLFTGPDENSQTVKNFEYSSIQEIELVYISGNWMLVRVFDYSKQVQVGWIRWRDNDGNIFVFPKLNN